MEIEMNAKLANQISGKYVRSDLLTCIVSQCDRICAIVFVALFNCKCTPFAVVNVIFVHSESEDIVFVVIFGGVARFFVHQNYVNLRHMSKNDGNKSKPVQRIVGNTGLGEKF